MLAAKPGREALAPDLGEGVLAAPKPAIDVEPRESQVVRRGLDESTLLDRDARLPIRQQVALSEVILAQRPGVNLGLVVLRRMQPGMLGALGYALANCRTLDQALATFIRYQRFVTDALRWHRPDAASVTLEVADPLAGIGHPVEAAVGMGSCSGAD